MFYVKNVPAWERLVRVLVGIGMIVIGMVYFFGILQYSLIATGIIAGLTGFLGFCPMCYMVGRKLSE